MLGRWPRQVNAAVGAVIQKEKLHLSVNQPVFKFCLRMRGTGQRG